MRVVRLSLSQPGSKEVLPQLSPETAAAFSVPQLRDLIKLLDVRTLTVSQDVRVIKKNKKKCRLCRYVHVHVCVCV